MTTSVLAAAVWAHPGTPPDRAVALRREAERALAAGPFTVVEKSRVPPSGDKHDFVSTAPYWWPDPGTPGGLPYIRRDGEVNPDAKRDADDVRLGHMTSAVRVLAAAYRETREERFAARAAHLLRVWFVDPATRMNPNLEFGQGIPGITTGRAEGIIATRALVDIVDAVRALAGASSWTERDEKELRAWGTAYASWLQTSALGREESAAANNHGTWYDAQLTALLLYTGQVDAARARVEQAKRRLASQIEADGRQPRELARTRSWSYSVMNLQGWFTLARLARDGGVDLWHYRTDDGRSLRGALDYLASFARRRGGWSTPQITPFDWKDLAPLLDEAAVAWPSGDYRALAEQVRQP